jgi:endonuclease/exonuclease/phosphatase family metal-dependent hydrolase
MAELLPATNVAPSPTPSPRQDVAAALVPLRVMSFNVRFGNAADGPNRWELRHDLLVRTIRQFAPDLLGVQEALDFQCGELTRALGDDYAFHGAGREDGRARGEFSAVFFRRARFEQLRAGHFWLSRTPDVPGSVGWDAELPRMASWVRVLDRSARNRDAHNLAAPLLFLNTHWDHLGKRARYESARLIRQKVREVNPGGPAVIVGDFNAREDDEEYAELLRAADDDGPRYVDAFREIHPERQTDEASFHGFKGGKEGSRIDWIVHSTDLRSVAAAIDRTGEDGRYPSDHFPVTAVLVRAERAGA